MRVVQRVPPGARSQQFLRDREDRPRRRPRALQQPEYGQVALLTRDAEGTTAVCRV